MPSNALLARWAGGWAERVQAASVTTYGRSEALLGVGALGSLAEVYRVADGQLDEFADPREETIAGLEPIGAADSPYVAFRVGDTLTVPDETLAAQSRRTMSITVGETKDGRAVLHSSFGQVLIAEEARLAQATKKMINGTLSGRSKVAQPVVPTFQPRGFIAGSSTPGMIAGMVAWWKGDDLSTLSYSGTTLTQWRDKSGNGRHLIRCGTIGSVIQTLVNTMNGRNVVTLDGTNGMWYDAGSDLIVAQPFTVYAALSVNDFADVQARVIASPGAGGSFPVNAPELRLDLQRAFIYGGSQVNNDVITGVGDYFIRSILDGASSSIQVGATTVTGNAGTNPLDRSVSVGAQCSDVGMSGGFVGDVAEIVIYDHATTVDEDASVRAYFNAEWAVTV